VERAIVRAADSTEDATPIGSLGELVDSIEDILYESDKTLSQF